MVSDTGRADSRFHRREITSVAWSVFMFAFEHFGPRVLMSDRIYAVLRYISPSILYGLGGILCASSIRVQRTKL